jgi:diguanylate cyclase (GGDEF)-like protein
MTSDSQSTCLRCQVSLAEDARYCHACGVAVTAAASGEYALYDLDRFFNYAVDILCIAGIDGYFKLVNPAFERTLGYTAEEAIKIPFVEMIHPEDRSETTAEVSRLAGGTPSLSFENRFRCKNGSYKHLEWTSYPEPATGLLYAVARDITEWVRQQDRVDALTGLASRRIFDETLPQEWSRARRLKVPIAFAVFDIDHLRDFNERYGPLAGDQCLTRVGAILQRHARRPGDLAARIGGHELGFLMHGGMASAQAVALCEKICLEVEDLKIPHDGPGGHGSLTISAGVAALVPDDAHSHYSLVASAIESLRQAKSHGRGRVVLA